VAVADEVWYPDKPPSEVRWLSFAAALLAVSGIFKIFDALWAFKYDDDAETAAEVRTVFFERDLTSWGWVWLGLGVLLIAAGFAVVKGAEWARWVGIVAAGLAAILSFQWIYFQPFWTILSVTLALLVIVPLVCYGGRRGVLGPDRR
jgi:hypothetical protein